MSAETAPGPDIFVQLDRPRKLRYTFSALCRLERDCGISFNDLSALVRAPMPMTKFRDILWAGLLEDMPGASVEDVEKIIPLDGLTEIGAKIVEALNIALGRPIEKKKENTPPAAVPSGGRSS
jgi:hypothetical protein